MTDQELRTIYQYAKLGKAAMDVTNHTSCVTEPICSDKTDYKENDGCCIACEWYEFCKLRQGVGK